MAKAGFTGEAWEGICQERSEDGLVCLLTEGHGGKWHIEEGVGKWPTTKK